MEEREAWRAHGVTIAANDVPESDPLSAIRMGERERWPDPSLPSSPDRRRLVGSHVLRKQTHPRSNG
jgi:hypothetical protein